MDTTKIILCIAIVIIGITTFRLCKNKKTKYIVHLVCLSAILGVLDWRMLSLPVFAFGISYILVYHTNIIKNFKYENEKREQKGRS